MHKTVFCARYPTRFVIESSYECVLQEQRLGWISTKCSIVSQFMVINLIKTRFISYFISLKNAFEKRVLLKADLHIFYNHTI